MGLSSNSGIYFLVTDDYEILTTALGLSFKGFHFKVWCPPGSNKLSRFIVDWCQERQTEECVWRGDLLSDAFYKKFEGFNQQCVMLVLRDDKKKDDVTKVMKKCLPNCKILSVVREELLSDVSRSLEEDSEVNVTEVNVTWNEIFKRPLAAEFRHLRSVHAVSALRKLLNKAERIALLLQPDPDPDGIASALALRTILKRNKKSTPIVTFGSVTRPENLAMIKLLDIEVTSVQVEELSQFNHVVMLDTQPNHFKEQIPNVTAVIDHHPVIKPYENISFVDIRPNYGATSTILTEYLFAAAFNLGQRLATALLYGIKADTLLLNREVIDADLDAFVSLYPKINYNLLRRIEKPELPLGFAPSLARSLKNFSSAKGILVSALGEVDREDLIPQIADFLLQFEDTEWSVCVGVFEQNIVMSVRNVGYVKNAGEVVKKIFIPIGGVGGGHRTMAKAIIPVAAWKKAFGKVSMEPLRDKILDLFTQEIA